MDNSFYENTQEKTKFENNTKLTEFNLGGLEAN